MRSPIVRDLLISTLCAGSALLAACAAPAAPTPPPERDQFARDWIRTYETRTQAEAQAQLAAMRKRWLGRRVTWEVEIVEPFCRDDACNVRAFDFARLPASATTAIGGALPRLELGRADFLALTRRCLAHGARCVARVEARLAELPADTDAPLRLRMDDARLVDVRAARTEERFERVVRPRVAGRGLSRSDRPDRS